MPEKAVRVATLAEMAKSRTIVAEGPSGLTYKVRPLNLERHALAGGVPANLRQAALKGAEAIDELLTGDDAAIAENGEQMQQYLDNLVRQVIVEPDLSDADLDILPPVDYRWAVRIAMGEEDRDGRGRRLWGREPLSLWGTFRSEHGCAEDCASCDRMARSVAEIQRGRVD